MNNTDSKYTQFSLCREMLETPDVIKNFNPDAAAGLAELVKDTGRVMLTGEGSSRIFPAKRVRTEMLRTSGKVIPHTEGSTQALEYDLSDWGVLGASNSGRTRELIRLFKKLKESGHRKLGGVTVFDNSPLTAAVDKKLILSCKEEKAVAATKSVAEQAMVWQAVFAILNGRSFPDTAEGAQRVKEALNTSVPEEFIKPLINARTIYFAGRNDGVAEEITLKTNEIVRKPSDFLEGTYAAHGIEEIMVQNDVVILMDPFEIEEKKFKECLSDGVGNTVIAISTRDTLFPTLKVPAEGNWKEYVLLAAGWNILVETGIASGINLDKTERARKVGNEVEE